MKRFLLLTFFLFAIIAAKAQIYGIIFEDNNANGVFDSGSEPPISGVQVQLLSGGFPSATTTSASSITLSSSGDYNYYFTASPGSYSLKFTYTGSTYLFEASTNTIANVSVTGTGTAQSGSFTYSSLVFASINAGMVPVPPPVVAPTIQASNLTFTSVGGGGMTLNWTRGNGTGGMLVVASQGSAVTGTPVNGNDYYDAYGEYGYGDVVGNGYVVYNGTGTSVNVSELSLSTNYCFAVYEYNGTIYVPVFQTSNPATGCQQTAVSISSPIAGKAIYFSGGGNSFCEGLGDVYSGAQGFNFFTTNAVFTIETWLQISNPTADSMSTIMGSTISSSEIGAYFGFDNRSSAGHAQQLFLGLYNGTGTPELQSYSATNVITDTAWHHVAVSVNGTNATFYVDGVAYSGSGTVGTLSVDSSIDGGYSLAGVAPQGVFAADDATQYPLRGTMDELRIWTTARTQTEIRNNLNLIMLGNETGLYSYYQFNYASGDLFFDPISQEDGVSYNASYITSPIPVALGTSNTQTVTVGGTYSFTGTNLQMTFPATGTYPNGDLVVSLLNAIPVDLPPSNSTSPVYWVVRSYGTNATFSALTGFSVQGVGTISASDAANSSNTLILYKRASNATGDTWLSYGGASSANVASSSVSYGATNNITSFSQVIIGSLGSSPLPVQLVSLSVETNSNNATLLWQTASEINNKGFEVEIQTQNDTAFTSIGFVNGNGTTTTLTDYSYTTGSLSAGMYYFRLKQVDVSGNYSYSQIVAAVINGEEASVSDPFPNPLSDKTNLALYLPQPEQVRISLDDFTGNELKVIEDGIITGSKVIEIDASKLPSSIYFIKIMSNSLQQVKRIVVVH